MFTGIIEEIGAVRQAQPGRLEIAAKTVLADTNLGDSIAVNGVCLTVTQMTPNSFTADVMAETLRRSSLGQLHTGSRVNLERAMAADGRFGGHIVSGHIDGIGKIASVRREGNAVWVQVQTPQEILSLIVQKGSIAIDGISLTVAEVTADTFSVSIIPHTGGQTILLEKQAGDVVNLENDVVAKYVQRLLQPKEQPTQSGGLSMELLQRCGF